jgi:hypothetical protein
MKYIFCTKYVDVVGTEYTEVELDFSKKTISAVNSQDDYEPESVLIDTQWVEDENRATVIGPDEIDDWTVV